MSRKLILFWCLMGSLTALGLIVNPVSAISKNQETAIREHCDAIRENLKEVQKDDARARVYLGSFYERILTNYITPLNVRLVENNLSTPELVENQNKIADTRTLFNSDFVSYQQDLEELVTMNCREKTEDFYNKLVKVRQKRKIAEQDTLKMRSLISEHVKLANQIKGKL